VDGLVGGLPWVGWLSQSLSSAFFLIILKLNVRQVAVCSPPPSMLYPVSYTSYFLQYFNTNTLSWILMWYSDNISVIIGWIFPSDVRRGSRSSTRWRFALKFYFIFKITVATSAVRCAEGDIVPNGDLWHWLVHNSPLKGGSCRACLDRPEDSDVHA